MAAGARGRGDESLSFVEGYGESHQRSRHSALAMRSLHAACDNYCLASALMLLCGPLLLPPHPQAALHAELLAEIKSRPTVGGIAEAMLAFAVNIPAFQTYMDGQFVAEQVLMQNMGKVRFVARAHLRVCVCARVRPLVLVFALLLSALCWGVMWRQRTCRCAVPVRLHHLRRLWRARVCVCLRGLESVCISVYAWCVRVRVAPRRCCSRSLITIPLPPPLLLLPPFPQENVSRFLATARVASGDADVFALLRSPMHHLGEYARFFNSALRVMEGTPGRDRDAAQVCV